MSDEVTRTFTITTSEEMMGRIERFLGCLHLFTNCGHSSTLALSQDGDGNDLVKVEGAEFNPQKYRVYADYLSRYSPKDKKVELVDPSLHSEGYTYYRDGYWQKNFGHLYEGEEQPWRD